MVGIFPLGGFLVFSDSTSRCDRRWSFFAAESSLGFFLFATLLFLGEGSCSFLALPLLLTTTLFTLDLLFGEASSSASSLWDLFCFPRALLGEGAATFSSLSAFLLFVFFDAGFFEPWQRMKMVLFVRTVKQNGMKTETGVTRVKE
jgi:hypothetical protein